jgi:hypothetical protein
MQWLAEIIEVFTKPVYWLSLLFSTSIVVFSVSWIYHGIVSSEIKKRGIEYGQIAVNKISRLSTALMILSVVSLVIAILVLSLG